VAAAERDDVVHDQEVAGEAELADGGQLVIELRVRGRILGPGAVPFPGALFGEMPQPAHLGVPGAHLAGR